MKRIGLLFLFITMPLLSFSQPRSYYWTDKGNSSFDSEVYPELEFEYYSNGYKAGEPCSAVMLAFCYLCEHGTQRNLSKAKQIIDAWATKSDVTAMAAMKFYAPEKSEFSYRQSVGSKDVVFPFAEQVGGVADISKSYKSLIYLEKQCNEGKLIDIRERDARELLNRIKLYCDEKQLMGVSLSGYEYIETVTYAGYSYEAKDTIKALFSRCRSASQVDSLESDLRALYFKIKPSGVQYVYNLLDYIKDARSQWKSPAYTEFLEAFKQKDVRTCKEKYAYLSDSEKQEAEENVIDEINRLQYPGNAASRQIKEEYLTHLSEMFEYSISQAVVERIRYYYSSMVNREMGDLLSNVGIREIGDACLVHNLSDLESLVLSPMYAEESENVKKLNDYRKSIKKVIKKSALTVIIVNCEPVSYFIDVNSVPYTLRETSYRGHSGYLQYAEKLSGIFEKYSNLVTPFIPEGKSWTEYLVEGVDPQEIDVDEYLSSSGFSPLYYDYAYLRYTENIAFLDLIKKIGQGVDKYEDYSLIDKVYDTIGKIVANLQNDSVRHNLKYDSSNLVTVDFLAPYKNRALTVYQNECALKAADELTIDSTKEQIKAVLSMPMTKETKAIVKKKTSKSYLKEKINAQNNQ